MENIELSFMTCDRHEGLRNPINPIYHHVEIIDVPEHVIIECAKRYLTFIMQDHKRRGKGEYGKIKVFNETLTYKDI